MLHAAKIIAALRRWVKLVKYSAIAGYFRTFAQYSFWMQSLRIQDKVFEPFISHADILIRIREMSTALSQAFMDSRPVFIPVLKGAFRFSSDLFEFIDFPCDIEFVQVRSYRGVDRSGKIELDNFPDFDFKDRTVIILEDIIDSGDTLNFLKLKLDQYSPKSFHVAGLLYKPSSYQHQIPIDFAGFEIENTFVVGYGMDYNQQGRYLNDIYRLIETYKHD